MRTATTVLTLLVLLTASAWSQSAPQHPASGYTHIGTFTAPVNPTPGGEFYKTDGKKSDITGEICVFRGGNGQISYMVNTVAIKPLTDVVDGLTTDVIFDLIVRTAVEQGKNLGYATSGTVSVVNDACVIRSGFGIDTRFKPCTSTSYQTRYFTVGGGTIN